MIQAVPFHPALLAAAAYKPSLGTLSREECKSPIDKALHYGQVYERFRKLAELLDGTNRRLLENPELGSLGLRIPLTDRLYAELVNTPPWSEVSNTGGRNLYIFKGKILSFLNRHLVRLTESEEYLYSSLNEQEFFPYDVPKRLVDLWIDTVGACYSKYDGTELGGCETPVQALWIANDNTCVPDEFCVCRIRLEADCREEFRIRSLNSLDRWRWEVFVREFLWHDPRLPFCGPDGPFGYRPPDGWQPGERPSRYGYKDALGGIWKWEGGRAQNNELNPFNGHWNVQLPDSQTRHRWIPWVETCIERTVRTQPDRVAHINVEPNGQLVDKTFEWSD